MKFPVISILWVVYLNRIGFLRNNWSGFQNDLQIITLFNKNVFNEAVMLEAYERDVNYFLTQQNVPIN